MSTHVHRFDLNWFLRIRSNFFSGDLQAVFILSRYNHYYNNWNYCTLDGGSAMLCLIKNLQGHTSLSMCDYMIL